MKVPKTALDKVVHCIRELKEHGGSSRQMIHKYLKHEFSLESTAVIKAALKKGVAKGVLTQAGQRFMVSGESYELPADQRVEISVLKQGAGEQGAGAGAEVTVAYVGTLDDGHQFDAASKFTFELGAGDVIKGWDQGILGMLPGEKRELVVPSKLGYGAKGSAPDIPPHATLHFVVTLKSFK